MDASFQKNQDYICGANQLSSHSVFCPGLSSPPLSLSSHFSSLTFSSSIHSLVSHCSQASVIIYIMKTSSLYLNFSPLPLQAFILTTIHFFISKTMSSQTPTSPIELISLSTTHPRAFPGMITVIT